MSEPSGGDGVRETGRGASKDAGKDAARARGDSGATGGGTTSPPAAGSGGPSTPPATKPTGPAGTKVASGGLVIDISKNPVGTAALVAAVVLVVLGIIASLTLYSGVEDIDDLRRFATVRDLLGIILGTGTLVLGIIGLTSRRTPRWGALIGLGIGSYVFLSSLASFIGSLMFV